MSSAQPQARRAYQSSRRRQQAAETRSAVLDSATRVFGERGWAATGMRDVARESGVSVETVYAYFGSKSDLLLAAIDVAVVGDAEPVPLARRDVFAALGQGSREERMQAAARLVTDIHRRTAGVNLALREAAASDPELDRVMREREDGRRANVEEGLSLVVGHPVTEQQADALWAVLDIGVYRMLTDLRAWAPQQYQDWLAGALDRLLDGGRCD
ncbi:MAG: helix-turn-helix domain-containing protein [Mycobacteriales bacterium]